MCGIVGIVGHSPVQARLYDGLTVLQHRGQDAAGIVTCDDNRFHLRKNNGLVSDVFRREHMLRLHGTMGIAHCRYPTAGVTASSEAQPFYVNSPFGIAIAHNGNLTNAEAVKRELFKTDRRHCNTSSDSEVLLNVFAHELSRTTRLHVEADDIFAAARGVHARCRGGYAVVGMIVGGGMFAFRDPWGIRPIVFGRRLTEDGYETAVASESVALDVLGFDRVRDLKPGEALFIEPDGTLHTQVCADETVLSPCIFEHVYLARPDSMIDDISVYKTRMRMGDRLADRIAEVWSGEEIDAVIPIPDTSRTAAMQVATHLGLKYREGFIKNRYVGRTFIMPGQAARMKSVRRKLNPIELEFRRRNVLLIDDSIVRGTTSQQIIQMARDAGANKVFLASAAPPVRYPNVYGIDMPAASELIAHDRTVDQIRAQIGADGLVYQTVPDLIASAHEGNPDVDRFEASVFDKDYVTGDIDDAYLARLESERNDEAKAKRDRDPATSVDLPSVG